MKALMMRLLAAVALLACVAPTQAVQIGTASTQTQLYEMFCDACGPPQNQNIRNLIASTPNATGGTFTNPTITGGTITGSTISGGTINNAVIGGSTPLAITGTLGTFSSLVVSAAGSATASIGTTGTSGQTATLTLIAGFSATNGNSNISAQNGGELRLNSGTVGGSGRFISLYPDNSERVRLTSAGALLIATTSADATITPKLQVNGAALLGDLYHTAPVTVKATTPYTVLTTDSGRVFTNEGASAKIVFNLPTAAANLIYTFYVQDGDGIQVVASTGDTIRIAANVSGAAGNIDSTTIGSAVILVAINATEWIAISSVGTWTVT